MTEVILSIKLKLYTMFDENKSIYSYGRVKKLYC